MVFLQIREYRDNYELDTKSFIDGREVIEGFVFAKDEYTTIEDIKNTLRQTLEAQENKEKPIILEV